MVARKDDNILNGPVFNVLKQPSILPDSICSPLEPLLVCGRLCGCQHLHKTISPKADPAAKVVGAGQVAIQRGAVELGQDVDFADAAIDAVAHRDIDQSVNTSNWHCRLSTCLCQGIKP